MSSDIARQAHELNQALLANGFDEETLDQQQVLCLAEETGEFVGAYRRWKGMARRSGPFSDVEAELADVVITAFVVADRLGVDLDAAVAQKLEVVFSRGWRTDAS